MLWGSDAVKKGRRKRKITFSGTCRQILSCSSSSVFDLQLKVSKVVTYTIFDVIYWINYILDIAWCRMLITFIVLKKFTNPLPQWPAPVLINFASTLSIEHKWR